MPHGLSGPVWVEDPGRAFVAAVVKSSTQKAVTVSYAEDAEPADPSKLDFDLSTERVYPRVEGRTGISEMDELKMLNMATVLDNVDCLFQMVQPPAPLQGINSIYSSVGPVLIAMNPFEKLPLYTKEWMDAYHKAGADPVQSKRLGPHAYRTAEEAYQGLRRNRQQSVVICGESGAGKTVTNRKMLEMLCEVAKKKVGDVRGQIGADPALITMTNELLESFGNASTTRNHNSSRFGKLTSLHFAGAQDFVVAGCGVRHYLLERSRVCGGPELERNFHIFYQLLRSDSAKTFGLESNPEAYEFTKDGAKLPQPGVYSEGLVSNDDKADFDAVQSRMEKAGFTSEMRTHVLEGLAAVLHLGNVKISGGKDSSSVDITGAAFTKACELLGVPKEALGKALTIKVTRVEKRDLESGIGLEDARALRNAVAKLFYSSIFDYIVSTIDETLTQTSSASTATIGLLDIFGFEDMATNGFEQMFINLTNERIQHLFNDIIFAREKKVYEDDGIADLDFLVGPNNIKCVELFLGCPKPRTAGIVGYLTNQITIGLDDEKIDGANFVSLLNRTYDRHEKYKVCTPVELNKVLKKKGLHKKGGQMAADFRECFFVQHYAGEILYQVKEFVPKSRDSFPPHLGRIMRSSSKEHIRDMFPEDAEGKGTVGEKFQAQLKDLAETLSAGDALFVRCIKSNQKMVPGVVDRVSVLEQLIRGGVVAALEMRAAGLPERMKLKEFMLEFGLLEIKRKTPSGSFRRMNSEGTVERKKCEQILLDFLGEESRTANEWAMGKTMVFMKSHVLTFLQSVKRFRITFYTRCVQRKLVQSRVRKVDHAMDEIMRAEALAASSGLQDLKSVKQAMGRAKELVEPVYKALLEARKKHGTAKENFDKVMEEMKPHTDTIGRVRQIASEASTVVNRLVTRKQMAENAFAQKVARAMSSAMELLQRVTDIKQDCDDCADVATAEELSACRSACSQADGKLQTLVQSTLPDLKAKGPDVDMEVAGSDDNWLKEASKTPAFNLDRYLEGSRALVVQAEQTSGAVLRLRREFLKAVSELEEQRSAASARLEALQGPAQQCIAVGFEEIVDTISSAVRADQRLMQLEAEAKDPDAFRESVAAYLAAVEAAVDAVDRGREELRRREEELRKRRELRRQLDGISEQISAALNLPSTVTIGPKVAAAQNRLNKLLREAAELRQKEDTNVEEWATRIQALQNKISDAVEECECKLAEERAERRDQFKKRASVFGATIKSSAPGGSVTDSPEKPSPGRRDSLVEDENDPQVIARQHGLEAHSALVAELDQVISHLKDAGVERSQVTSVINKIVKARFPLSQGLAFSPEKRK